MALPSVANAQTAFYLGGAIGQSNMRQGCGDLPAGLSCKQKDTGWKAFGGYQFTPRWGVEAEYLDAGRTKANGTYRGFPTNADAKVTGLGLVGTGTFPVATQFDLFAKLGVFRGTVKSSATVGTATTTLTGHSTKATFGGGAKWNFSQNWAARLEWERFSKVGDSTTGTSDIDLLSVGIQYKF
jgi:OOP family OmpA-OmpF porin